MARTLEDMAKFFADRRSEYIKWSRVENRRSRRPGLHALLLLDELAPGDRDMIAGAEHDLFWLDVDLKHIAKVATDEQLIELIRCGVKYDERMGAMYFHT